MIRVIGDDKVAADLLRAAATVEAKASVVTAAAARTIGGNMAANTRSSRVAASVEVTDKGDAKWAVGPTHFLARFEEFGTNPHVILPKNGRVLASPDTVFGPRASHPGTPQRPFVEQSVQPVIPVWHAALQRVGVQV